MIFGETSKVFETLDGGDTWKVINDTVTFGLNSPKKVYFYNDTLGFLSTNSNNYRTHDGGTTWKIITGSLTDFSDLQMISPLKGYALRGGFILETLDGGKSWKMIPNLFFPYGCHSMNMPNDSIIYAQTEQRNGKVLEINLKSKNVIELEGFEHNLYQNDYYINNQNGFIWTNYRIYYTEDGGKSWVKSNFTGDSTRITGRRMQFLNDKVGYLWNDYYSLIKTTDGGKNWNIADQFAYFNYWNFNGIEAIESKVIAVGTNQNTVQSEDNGVNCNLYNNGDVFEYPNSHRSVKFFTKDIGIVCGDKGRIFITENGGAKWDSVSTNMTQTFGKTLRKIHLVSDKVAFICGDEGVILTTNNSGKSWSQCNSPDLSESFQDITFIDSKIGFAVGAYYGPLYTTEDGGINWRKVDLDASIEERGWVGIVFRTPENGILYSEMGKMAITTDKGKTWKLLPDKLGYLTKIIFITDKLGWATGGSLWKTLDGGNTWKNEDVSMTFPMYDIVYGAKSKQLYLAGSYGSIWKNPLLSDRNSLESNQDFKMFPNPAQTKVQVSLENKTSELKIFNMIGQNIQTIFTQGVFNLDISTEKLTNGVYQIQILGLDGKIYSQKLIITQ